MNHDENQQLRNRLQWANRRTKFAWAKYYEAIGNAHGEAVRNIVAYQQVIETEAIPVHIKNQYLEMASQLQKKWECPCCLDTIGEGNLTITNCGHFYCKGCLQQHQQAEQRMGRDKWACATCRRKHPYKDEDEN